MENETPVAPPLPASGLAVATLVLGICSIATCFCYGIPSIICAIIALVLASQANQQVIAGTAGGQGMIKAGRICGIIGLILSVLSWIIMIIWFVFIASTMKDTLKHAQEQQAHQTQQTQPDAPPAPPAPQP